MKNISVSKRIVLFWKKANLVTGPEVCLSQMIIVNYFIFETCTLSMDFVVSVCLNLYFSAYGRDFTFDSSWLRHEGSKKYYL